MIVTGLSHIFFLKESNQFYHETSKHDLGYNQFTIKIVLKWHFTLSEINKISIFCIYNISIYITIYNISMYYIYNISIYKPDK